MKKIYILSQWMNIDGVEASLLGLLKELDYSKVEVDLFLQYHVGPWMREIPREVNLLPACPALNTSDWVSRALKKISIYLAGAYYHWVRHCKIEPEGLYQIAFELGQWRMPKYFSEKEYDLALVFGGNPGYARHVKAKVKAAWVHTDWSTCKIIPTLARRQFVNVDYVVNVGAGAKAAFDGVVHLRPGTKSVVVENVLSPKWMKENSTKFSVEQPTEASCLKILSVGRLSGAKCYKRAVQAAKLLLDKGLPFKWIIVGEGEERELLEAEIERLGVEGRVELVGMQPNPYPYYDWCDMLVCTSDTEGKSVAVREAQIFAKPVVCTRYPTATSQIEDGVDGILVDCTSEAVASAVSKLYGDADSFRRISENCKKRDYANLKSVDNILLWANL